MLPFELPKNFNNPERYNPGEVPEEVFDSVPHYVGDAVFLAMGPEVPLDPFTVFSYLRCGNLAHFVVDYFMTIQKKNLATQTRFFRALWLIHLFREFMILPPVHHLSQFDAASVQAVGRLAGDDQVHQGGAGLVDDHQQDAGAEEDQQQDAGAEEDVDEEGPALLGESEGNEAESGKEVAEEGK